MRFLQTKFDTLRREFLFLSKDRETNRLFWWLNGIFIAFNAFFLLNEIYWFLALPAVVIITIFTFRRLDLMLFLISFITPLSIEIHDIGLGFGLSVPGEPLIMLMLLVFVFKVLISGALDRDVLTHPLSLVFLGHLVWMLITCLTSTMPVVSFKFFLSRTWFVLLFYYFATTLFSDKKNARIFVNLYSIALCMVIVYTLYQHYLLGFDEKAAHWVMSPFYNDHTAYAAVISMFLPVILTRLFSTDSRFLEKGFYGFMILLFLLGLILSYTRAAWVSIAGALAVFILISFKIKFRTVAIFAIAGLCFFILFGTQIQLALERNRQDSSKDFSKHLKSITNISTDASNLERINRWHSAVRMFEKRPISGFGPGTYQFQYAPFQHSYEKTIISTDAGTNGTAHSEYLLPLAEQGLVGSVFFVLIVALISITAINVISSPIGSNDKRLVLGVFLGLVTYFIHAFLNNFLDTDKASIPFWGFAAIIAAASISERRKRKISELAIR